MPAWGVLDKSTSSDFWGFVQAREVAETEEELVLLRMQEREDALAARAVATELLCARAAAPHALPSALPCLALPPSAQVLARHDFHGRRLSCESTCSGRSMALESRKCSVNNQRVAWHSAKEP